MSTASAAYVMKDSKPSLVAATVRGVRRRSPPQPCVAGRDRLIDQHQRDRAMMINELRKDAQLQLFDFDHWDGAPPGAEQTTAIPPNRTAISTRCAAGRQSHSGYGRREPGVAPSVRTESS